MIFSEILKIRQISFVLFCIILSEFPVELAAPVGKIFRRVLETNVWPRNWSLKLGLALKKSTLPETESQTRLISLTAFWSKCLEGFVIDWLFQAI